MSEQEMKRQRIYDLINAETKPQFPFSLHQAQTFTSSMTLYGAF